MKVYLVHEIEDYGLSNLELSKVFTTLEKAVEYSEECRKTKGWVLDIIELELVG